MNDTKNKQTRGRPRKLDADNGLEKALTLFQKYGFENVSVAELCRNLAATPTSLYATYGNKQTLFSQAIALYKSKFFGNLETVLKASNNSSEMFRQCLEMSLEFYLNDNQKCGCLILQGNTFCRNKSLLSEIENYQIAIQLCLKNRLHELGSESAEELADVLMTLMRGIALSVKSETDEDKLYTTLEFFCTAFEC
ncbi:TetR/AcrR family transcriptional regulator [Aliiglaciecola lipolytica]|uniref:HTH tetR-type domain-containing protein n=1 Tax=Aliiglaciecola lipolytica E3 TaxID=1127673 RepID=K6YFD0_9ALTE|nr:TetR/AcrR family transcriptional regulator [Aliiglaciecola lipolytica]GAC15313.1 hypothetical protein GLIP_2691 [Aliiglaciecola lipolytica E3]